MIRAFVGVALPAPLASAIHAAQAGLPFGTPVERENLHLTLAFLGAHPVPVIEDMHLALGQIRASGFAMALDGLGAFGKSTPRQIYAGVPKQPEMVRLRDKVVRCAQDCEITLERKRFVPHVTLARRIGALSPDEAAELDIYIERRMPLRADPEWIEEFTLYESFLGKNGPHYEPLARYPLHRS